MNDKNRRYFSPEQKVAILREHLIEGKAVSDPLSEAPRFLSDALDCLLSCSSQRRLIGHRCS
jgi:hypothetical protein